MKVMDAVRRWPLQQNRPLRICPSILTSLEFTTGAFPSWDYLPVPGGISSTG